MGVDVDLMLISKVLHDLSNFSIKWNHTRVHNTLDYNGTAEYTCSYIRKIEVAVMGISRPS